MEQRVVGRRIFQRSLLLRRRLRPVAKRIFDISAALLIIGIILPLLLIITLSIIISGQNPLYGHTRIGRNGKAFRCLKFRSMRNDADVVLTKLLAQDADARSEWEATRKLRVDPRITGIGMILRATSLDELPQLFNVIAGHMSLVGPRPITNDELRTYYGPLEATAYMSVRPGVTGLWQVSGRSQTTYSHRVELDTRYVQQLSLRTDLVIMVQTVNVVIRRKGAW